MFYILENEEQLTRLESLGEYSCYFDIITSNDNFHPKLSSLVAVYIRPMQGSETVEEKGYIIPVNHDEGIGVEVSRIGKLLKKFSKIYILDKKAGLYFFNLGKNVCDLSLKYAMTYYKRLETNCTVLTYNWFYNRYGGLENLNQVIPLTKIYEKCENIFEQVKKIIELPEPDGFDFYNEKATKLYWLVEQAGLRVDSHEFIEKFKPQNPNFSIKNEIVYNSYNLYNSTSRPTNSFNAVNFLAIPKGEEFRRVFKPQNDKFVEMDFDGYHVRLVADRVDYQIDTDVKAHKALAELYLGKKDFSKEEYAKAKVLNFQMIYGTPPEECRYLEISKRIQKLVDKLWIDYQNGAAHNPDSNKAFTQELEDMYPQKLFNYYIQSLETSRNVRVLYKVLKFLCENSYKSKVVLITYDSFLIDWDESEGEEVLQGIKACMEMEAGKIKYPVGIKVSQDLRF